MLFENFAFLVLVLITTTCTILFLWYGVSILYRKAQTNRLRSLCSTHKAIVLTYDDGPSISLSAQLVSLLIKRNRHATFFLLGQKSADQPKIANLIAQAGHEIGNHTHSHSNAWKTNPWRHYLDVRRGTATLNAIGLAPNLYRPPFGKTSLGVLIQLRVMRAKLAFWTIDSQDSWNRRPIPDIIGEIKAKNGGVILMHDRQRPLRGPSPELHPEYLLELTTAILDLADEEAFKVLRFGELFTENMET